MYYVYIMTNKNKTVLYTGITNDLQRRVYEHRNNVNAKSFTSKYKAYLLVYYETTTDVKSAIAREKQIKNLLRKKKEELINQMNPKWTDLSFEWE